MVTSQIRSLFTGNIDRNIEEVIKVDQNDEEIIRGEIDDYVITDAIARHYEMILDLYAETPNKPHEGIAVWVSGFFGSGKSSFAKMLGLAIEDREIVGTRAGVRFGAKANKKIQVLLNQIVEKIPTHAVIFDVSTDRGIRSGNQTLTCTGCFSAVSATQRTSTSLNWRSASRPMVGSTNSCLRSKR